MKILFLAPANNVHTKKWLDYYDSIGIEVVNISLANHKDSQENSWTHIKRVYLDLVVPHKIAYFFTVGKLNKIIKDEKPDLLHSHYASSYGLIGALANFHPYILSVWGSDIYDFPKKNFISKGILEFALKKSDVICSTSPALERETKKYLKNSKPMVITPFGVDIMNFKPKEKSHEVVNPKFKIGIAKGMEPKYGVEYLINGFKLFLDGLGLEEKEVELEIAGDGPYLEEYKQLTNKLGITDKVNFLGRVDHAQIPKFISSLDVFVIPSLIESFGVAAVEAQACGVPVIASNVGGLPEVVKDGVTGFLVPPEDAQKIAEKLELLYTNESKRTEFGISGREHVILNYDWNENTKLMSDLYKEIVIESGGAQHEDTIK
ncbi:glycosyltransferase [Bacillus sp. 2205SS5-2]|uniref:glycosyltransferase n=1 Tax=Bacillus sp. 2205SS5-2 TaxID=3109031 RepID=UPI0030042E94